MLIMEKLPDFSVHKDRLACATDEHLPDGIDIYRLPLDDISDFTE